jgi:hypothetical protein
MRNLLSGSRAEDKRHAEALARGEKTPEYVEPARGGVPSLIRITKVVLCRCVSLFRGLAIPRHRLHVVLRNTLLVMNPSEHRAR